MAASVVFFSIFQYRVMTTYPKWAKFNILISSQLGAKKKERKKKKKKKDHDAQCMQTYIF